MTIDANAVSGLFIAATTFILFLYSQASSRAQAQRRRSRRLERRDDLRARYIYRLETKLSSLDIAFPDRPEGYDIAMEDDDE